MKVLNLEGALMEYFLVGRIKDRKRRFQGFVQLMYLLTEETMFMVG